MSENFGDTEKLLRDFYSSSIEGSFLHSIVNFDQLKKSGFSSDFMVSDSNNNSNFYSSHCDDGVAVDLNNNQFLNHCDVEFNSFDISNFNFSNIDLSCGFCELYRSGCDSFTSEIALSMLSPLFTLICFSFLGPIVFIFELLVVMFQSAILCMLCSVYAGEHSE